jgi:bacteriorhodopsin
MYLLPYAHKLLVEPVNMATQETVVVVAVVAMTDTVIVMVLKIYLYHYLYYTVAVLTASLDMAILMYPILLAHDNQNLPEHLL